MFTAATQAGGNSTTSAPSFTLNGLVWGTRASRSSNVLCAWMSVSLIQLMEAFFADASRREISVNRDSLGLGFVAVIVRFLSRTEADPRSPQNVADFPSRS